MKFRAILAAAVVLAMATSAQAISLVVMATNTTAIAGEKVYTIGVQVTAADVAAGGPNAVMVVQNVTFTSGAGGPFNQTGAANKADVSGVQTSFIDVSAGNQGGPPDPTFASNGSATAVANANSAFYKDSWWYNSAGGTLAGVVDAAGDSGVVTTVPAADGSGVYTLGAASNGTTGSGTGAVGVTGYLFQAAGSPGAVPTNALTGQTMSNSGLFGPTGSDFWDASPSDPNHILGNLLVANGGTLTIPLAQIVASGNVLIPSAISGGAGTFLEMGTPIYNVLGGPVGTDPGAYLDYTTNTIHGLTPEPGSIVMAVMGGLGLLLAWKRRK